MRLIGRFLTLVTILHAASATLQAQPLVTGNLSLYYSFDSVDEDGFWMDGSGNDLHGLTVLGDLDANEDDLIDIRLDTEDKVRGAGSVWFDTNTAEPEDFVAVCDPITGAYDEGCDIAIEKSLAPTTGFTVAAWVKVEDVGADHSVWQSRAEEGGFIHTQVQGNAGVRMRLRGRTNDDNVVQFNELPGGEPVPFEEWFHWAGTYEKGDVPEDPGEWVFYFNGEDVAGGAANGNVAGDPELDTLGDWVSGAFIGLTPDFARQLVGRMDEFYLFTRAITADEVKLLANPIESVPGDFDGDGQLSTSDIDALTRQSAGGLNPPPYDLNADTLVNSGDVDVWAKELYGTWMGDANLDKEFNSNDLVVVLASGTYEADVDAVWSSGDFNGDGRSNSADLVVALSDGGYENGPKAAVASVPEPAAATMVIVGLMALLLTRRR